MDFERPPPQVRDQGLAFSSWRSQGSLATVIRVPSLHPLPPAPLAPAFQARCQPDSRSDTVSESPLPQVVRCKRHPVQSAQAVMTKCHRLQGLNSRHISHSSGGWAV